jgi:hypothetical protein
MDFFARTEMDRHTLDAHSEYKRAVEAADHASEVSLALFAGGESLRADFECAMSEGKTRESGCSSRALMTGDSC